MPAVMLGPFVWLVLAAVVAHVTAAWAGRRTGADREALDRLVSDVILWALLGSRLIYALADPYGTIRQPARLLLLNGLLAAWGAAAGAALAVLYHALRHRIHQGATRNGAVLILAAAGPALLLAWSPAGTPSPLAAPLGPLHPVAFYYAAAHTAVAAAVWQQPDQAVRRHVPLLGAMFLIIENFRQAPLILGLATPLQLAGAATLLVGLAVWQPGPEGQGVNPFTKKQS